MATDKKTRPQDRWDKKNDYISKSYRMYRKTAEEFAEACKAAGVSQSGQIVKMMQEFIDQHKNTQEKPL